MAIGWMTILQNVPWSDVIRNAPKVADGAKKLWRKVGGKGGEDEAGTDVADGAADLPVEARLAHLQAQVDALHGQMLASSEVIQSLAEQNAQLIVRIEVNRRRLLWLAAGNVVVLLLALAAWLR